MGGYADNGEAFVTLRVPVSGSAPSEPTGSFRFRQEDARGAASCRAQNNMER